MKSLQDQVVSVEGARPVVRRALESTLRTLGLTCYGPGSSNLAVVVALTESDLVDGLIRLGTRAPGRLYVYGLTPERVKGFKSSLSDVAQGELSERVTFEENSLGRLLSALATGDAALPARGPGTLGHELQAKVLWPIIREFSHNEKYDLTNSLLGPLAILAPSREDSASVKSILGAGERKLGLLEKKLAGAVEKDPLLHGQLGAALLAGVRSLQVAIGSDAGVAGAAVSARCVMDLLTTCRELAKASTVASAYGATAKAPAPIRPSDGKEPDYRILVVDDFAEAWRPVLVRVAERLKDDEDKGFRAAFEFSVNGQDVRRSRDDELHEVETVLPTYDLVLQDVFLGERRGLEELKKIRDRNRWLPVLLWTTSQAYEIPAGAQLANGFINKKKADLDDIVTSIAAWLDEGRAHKEQELLTRVFNEQIKSRDYRRVAFLCEQWALRELDSFHASGDLFRYFTDHGGRHVTALFRLLGELIGPVQADARVFSKDPDEKEIEFLSLYLAVLFHELGMFPLAKNAYLDGKVSAQRKPLSSDSARKVHGVLSAALLYVKGRGDPGMTEVVARVSELREGERLLARVATLAAYHQRLLDLNLFLDKEHLSDQVRKKLGTERPPEEAQDAVVQASHDTIDWITTHAGNDDQIKRLRLQAAFLRFADGIEIGWTRAPAQFLLDGESRRWQDNLENTMSHVVQEVRVGDGQVLATFRVPKPDAGEFDAICEILAPAQRGKRRIELNGLLTNAELDPRDWESVRTWMKFVEELVEGFWTAVRGDRLTPGAKTPQVDGKQARIAASLMALLVAGRILEEWDSSIGTIGKGDAIPLSLGPIEWTDGFEIANVPILAGLVARGSGRA